MFEKIFKPKPKPGVQERQSPRKVRTPEEVMRDKEEAVAEARRKFELEKPGLERRLADILGEIEDLGRGLKEMQGPEMRKILDKEHQLNSAQSPVSSTDPNRQREYEMWVSALNESRGATARMKQDLEARIQKKKAAADELKQERATIEQRIQRGY